MILYESLILINEVTVPAGGMVTGTFALVYSTNFEWLAQYFKTRGGAISPIPELFFAPKGKLDILPLIETSLATM